jgi:hypothetical protein
VFQRPFTVTFLERVGVVMATATAKKASKGLVPAVRPENLTDLNEPTGAPPVDIEGTTDKEVFAWAEGLRNHHQENGELLTYKGMRQYANSIESDEDKSAVRQALKRIYKPDAGDGASTPAPKGTAKKEVAKSSTNGKAKAKAAKPKVEKEPASEGTPLSIKNKVGIEVVGTEGDSGRKRVKIFGYPLRNILRWMGKNDWDTDMAMKTMDKLGLGDYHENLREIVGCHVAAGRSNSTTYGPIPKLDKGDAQKLLAIRPEPTPKKEKVTEKSEKATAKPKAKAKAKKVEEDE